MGRVRLSFTVFLLLLVRVCIYAQDPPMARLISEDFSVCKGENVPLSFEFHGEKPFDFILLFENEETGALLVEQEFKGRYPLDVLFDEGYTIDFEVHKVRVTLKRVKEKDGVWNENVEGSTLITIYNMPEPSAGDPIEECGYSVILSAVPDAKSIDYYWEDVDGAYFNESDNPNAVFSVDDDGTYELTFVQVNGFHESGEPVCEAKSTVEVNLKGAPSGRISTESEVCGEGEVEILISELSGYSPWDYEYSDGVEVFSVEGRTIDSEVFSHFVEGEKVFSLLSITDKNGCSASEERIMGEAFIADLTPVVDAGNDQSVCGLSLTLDAVGSPGIGHWSGSADINFSDINSGKSRVESTNYGAHTLTWTVINKGWCEAYDEIDVTFYEEIDRENVSAGSDMVLYHKFDVNLSAEEPLVGTGKWSLISGLGSLSSGDSRFANISGLTFGLCTLRWTVSNGVCPEVYDELTIEVKGLKHPTGFSPNDIPDGFNDKFIILGAANVENNKLMVFNKSGEVVFQKSDYGSNDHWWDGTDSRGNPLPEDTYYFTFSGNGIKTIRDFLVIKR